MKSKKDFEEAASIAGNLADALSQIDCQTATEIKDDLAREGINLDDSLEQFSAFLDKCNTEARRKRLDFAAEERKKFDIQISRKKLGWSREELLSAIRSLMTVPEAAISTSFRDLENKESQDLETILEDIEISILRKRQDEEVGDE